MKSSILLTLLLFALTACVTQPVKEENKIQEHNPRLRIGQNGDGSVVLEWDSDANYLYTVYFSKEKIGKKNIWKTLPQATKIKGTGKLMIVHDKVSPHSSIRYRLYFEKSQ